MQTTVDVREIRDCKRQAGELLSQNGTRLTLVEAILVSLLCVPLYVMTSFCFSFLLEWTRTDVLLYATVLCLFCVTIVLLTALLTLPMLMGLFYIARHIVTGGDACVADLFYFFTEGSRYRRAVGLSFYWCLRVVISVSLVFVTYLLCSLYLPLTQPWLLMAACLIALEIFFGVLWLLSSFPLLHLSLSCEAPALSVCAAQLSGHAQNPLSRGLRFFVGFFFWLLLGVLTCGVLLLWDVFPRMLLTYSIDCEAWEQNR